MGSAYLLRLITGNMLRILFFTLISYTQCSIHNESDVRSLQPSWVDLECQAGHKYLYSDDELIWEEARARCELFNGWLVDIGDVHEQNCLMKHALATDELHNYYYWTDVNDLETTGVWMHASTDTEVTFFGPKSITCWYGDENWRPGDGNAIVVFMTTNQAGSGVWCNTPSTNSYRYICKALI